MERFRNDFRIGICGGACIFLALCLLILPLRWIVAGVVAGAFHELCHAGAVLLCGGQIHSLRIGRSGAVMSVSRLSFRQETICALAGPLGSLLLMFLFRWFPRVAFCGMIHCIYNLLPVYPLDGGRAVHCITSELLPAYQYKICKWAENICLVFLLVIAAYMAFWLHLGLTPMFAAAALILRAKSANTPCKPGNLALQ